jgi:protein kinase C substrate 80K-H
VFLIENGVIAPDTSGGESPAVTSARTELNAGQTRLRELQTDRDNHAAEINKDYGPEGLFRALKDRCVSRDSGEYTYELCWMDRTKQKPKKGGGETNMGNFVSFGTTTVDEDLPADGRGLGKGERMTMKFENGQGCWNGPARSTTVVLACAENDEIWRVAEEEKCVYRMEVGTPAVCEAPAQKPVKDEL